MQVGSVRVWAALSYVPGMEQHRVYTETVAWLDASMEIIRSAFGPDIPDFPKVIRHPTACVRTVEGVLPFLYAAQTFHESHEASKGDVDGTVVARDIHAVIQEHLPSWFTEGEPE